MVQWGQTEVTEKKEILETLLAPLKIKSEVKDVAIIRLWSPANSNEKQVGNFFDPSSQ